MKEPLTTFSLSIFINSGCGSFVLPLSVSEQARKPFGLEVYPKKYGIYSVVCLKDLLLIIFFTFFN